MKKLITVFGSFFLLSNAIVSQTVEQFTQWNQNHYLFNPAAAGNQNYFDVATGFRKQWAGVKDAPQTFYATGHTVINRPRTFESSALRISESSGPGTVKKGLPGLRHAVGAKVNTSQFGAFGKLEAMLTYAIHLPVTDKINLSFGISGGLNSLNFDESKAKVLVDNDPVYNAYSNGQTSNQLNINSGTYLYSDRFFFGYSVHQLLQNDLQIADIQTTSDEANLELHHFIMGGYHFDLTNDFRLTPSVLLKKLNPNPLSYDINATLTYKQEIYIGASYRSSNAISAMLGIQFNHFLRAGYAYDFLTSDLSERAGGSHEIFVGLTIF